MESSGENCSFEQLKNRPKPQYREKSPNHSKTQRNKKKIKKISHKKQGTISKHRNESPSIILQLLTKVSSYFSKPKQEIISSLKKQYRTNVHISNLIRADILTCFLDKREDLTLKEEALKSLIRSVGNNPALGRIGLINLQKGTKLCIPFLRDLTDTNERHHFLAHHRLLSQSQYALITRRPQIMSQIVMFVNSYGENYGYSSVKLNQILLQLLSFCKLNNEIQTQLQRELSFLDNNNDYLLDCHTQEKQIHANFLKNEYAKALIIKNLQNSFSQQKIDFLNYHKKLEYYEDNDFFDNPFEKITSISEFKKYIQKKKPRSSKKPVYLLRTPCSACLSDIGELSNPIVNCPECQIRLHRSCQRLENRCHRCKYGRTSNQQKKQSSYCYICKRSRQKGLMILTVTNKAPHKFAHNYCLFLHNLWTMKDEICYGQFVEQPLHVQICIFCQKNQGLMVNCKCCGNMMHGMCSYLQGCSFKMKKGVNFDYKVEVSCCIDPQLKERLMRQRGFKLNIEKQLFRQSQHGELFEYIKSQTAQNQLFIQ